MKARPAHACPQPRRPGPGEADATAAGGAPITTGLTLSTVCGPDLVFCGRPHPGRSRWLPHDPAWADAVTATHLCVAGEMPTLCHQAAADPAALALLRQAGLAPGGPIHTYDDEAGYRRQLARLRAAGYRFLYQFLQPPGLVEGRGYWIDPGLLSWLNNKANLARLVPAPHHPRRELMPPGMLAEARLPCVIKAATDDSSGGGVDVAVCHSPEQLRTAGERFRDCERVVVEEWLEMTANLCLNYAALGGGEVRYLGAAEQICDRTGRFLGNWVDPRSEAPARAVRVGLETVRAAARRGYRGFAGVDLALLDDGAVRVFDLNFRLNASTKSLLLRRTLVEQLSHEVLRPCTLRSAVPFEALLRLTRGELERGRLLPLSLFDGQGAGGGGEHLLFGILLGDSRGEVREYRAALARRGLRAN